MKKITEEAKSAWDNRIPFNKSNTVIKISNGCRQLYLFDNLVAWDTPNGNGKPTGEVRWSMRGWNSVTTRERLNGILGLKIVSRQMVPYLRIRLPETDNFLQRINEYEIYKLGGQHVRVFG